MVGIVAGKLKETYQCPSAVFAKADDVLKGSIRSITDVHVKDLLDLVDRDNPELIEKFGGHAMAAGLTIKPDNFEMFKNVAHPVPGPILFKMVTRRGGPQRNEHFEK